MQCVTLVVELGSDPALVQQLVGVIEVRASTTEAASRAADQIAFATSK